MFLIGMLFMWRFELDAGGVSLPAYFILTFVVLLFHQRTTIFKQLLLVWVLIFSLFPLVLLQGVEYQRLAVALVTWVLLIANFQAIGFSIREVQADNWRTLARFAKAALIVHVAIQMAELSGFQFLNNRITPHPLLPIVRPTGLSVEPSHIALLLSPLIFSSFWPRGAAWSGNIHRVDYALVYFSLFLAPSLTAIIVIFAALVFRVSARYPVSTAVIGLPIFLSFMDISYVASYFPPEIADRVQTLVYIFQTYDFDRQTNVSAVVFFGGYQAATASLTEFPFGFGFMNMAESYGTTHLESYVDVVGDKNINDGSSMLFKLVAEFGYLGVGIVVVALASFVSFISSSRSDITVAVLAFPFFATFARGAGYFDAFALVGLTLLFLGLGTVASWKRSTE